MTSYRILHEGKYNERIYQERVSRSLCFLGRNENEQQAAQERLSKAVVGIAGTGGIGGAMAMRLARLGVRHLKIADPQDFDWTNVNRQLGASAETIGRNKAEVVGELTFQLAGDVTIEVYKDGITKENAAEFVDGCDLILDQLEFYVIPEKYALHRAFRQSATCKEILACSVVGWAAHLYKFEKDSMPLEEWYGVAEDANFDAAVNDRLIKLWAPRLPHFPSYNEILQWIDRNDAVPIFAGAPPLAEGILTQRVALSLINKEYPPYAEWLPPIPQMYCYDAATFHGQLVTSDGRFKNEGTLAVTWRGFGLAAD
ncbi:ThiF family adenylyltransferase [Tepidicaulis sp. LMO-SS28]|uniref:ThiF family adenylyltransferase n=1 Tax=Tepidicaulis sp. LMO-SS28 TaxID=3447455 RepID=UPI003EE38DA0